MLFVEVDACRSLKLATKWSFRGKKNYENGQIRSNKRCWNDGPIKVSKEIVENTSNTFH